MYDPKSYESSTGEYYTKKHISSPAGKKIVKKFLHIFHFQKWKIVPNCTFYLTRGMGGRGEIHPFMPKY